jgi:hypothetical protein
MLFLGTRASKKGIARLIVIQMTAATLDHISLYITYYEPASLFNRPTGYKYMQHLNIPISAAEVAGGTTFYSGTGDQADSSRIMIKYRHADQKFDQLSLQLCDFDETSAKLPEPLLRANLDIAPKRCERTGSLGRMAR